MAAVLQLLDMNNAEFERITEHLGHTQDVHKAWYLQEASTVELTKVAKTLIAKDVGVEFTNRKMKDLTGNVFFFLLMVAILYNKQNNFNPIREFHTSKTKQTNFSHFVLLN